MPAGNIFPTTVAFLETNHEVIDKLCDVLAWGAGEVGDLGGGSLLAHSSKGVEGIQGVDSVDSDENVEVVEGDDTVATRR